MNNIQVFFIILSFYDDGKDGITGITYDSLFQVKFGHTTTFKASAIRPSSKPCFVKSNCLLDLDTKAPRVYSVKLGVPKSCSMPRTMFLFVFDSRTDWGSRWRIEVSRCRLLSRWVAPEAYGLTIDLQLWWTKNVWAKRCKTPVFTVKSGRWPWFKICRAPKLKIDGWSMAKLIGSFCALSRWISKIRCRWMPSMWMWVRRLLALAPPRFVQHWQVWEMGGLDSSWLMFACDG